MTESGTNEAEFIAFLLGAQSFGVNVAKVREIISYNPDAITPVPEAYHSVLGMMRLRDTTLPLIDLKDHLEIGGAGAGDGKMKVVLVCEFNDMVNGFLVDGVSQIHRCSWNAIEPLSPYISQHGPSITSSINIGGENILLVDLEHVLTDIYPQTRYIYREEEDPEHARDIPARHHEREMTHIIVADDSPIVRASVRKIADETGYTNLTLHDNGLDTFNEVAELKKKASEEGRDITEYVSCVVTDIEMPGMDGLTVCRKIKEDLGLAGLPVIMFSSLINDQMIAKCRSVGADDWANKLKISDLIHILDRLCLKG